MYSFRTKAETLDFLYAHRDNIKAEILPLYYFGVKEWMRNAEGIWESTQQVFLGDKHIIVRSSAKNEDSLVESMAGKYTSKICLNTKEDFFSAVKKVIASYTVISELDQVLVQPVLENVQCAGVAFTIDPNTGGNYYVINYDDESGSTTSVTDGTGKNIKLFYWFKDGAFPEIIFLKKICQTLKKLEQMFRQQALDVEFAISENELYIFQVRALCAKRSPVEFDRQKECLKRIENKIVSANSSKPFLYGKRTVFGVMPDWNPAEMIGIHPHNLALSLYKEIITDNVWAYQRDNYGYKNLRSFPLMLDFCGLPYIDVRVSFNSFIPNELEPAIADKLVDYYLNRLVESPDKHDKVEFDIIFSCYTIDLPKRIRVLAKYGFTELEIEKIILALKKSTNRIINSETGLWRKDSSKIKTLEKRYEEIISSDLSEVDKIYWLIEDCKRYGTLPFAGLARAAFIAVQILQSLVNEKIISKQEYDSFLNDLTTISAMMNKDFEDLSIKKFLLQYGHLRPGTYDITSPRYDEMPQLYFQWDKKEDIDFNEKDSIQEHFRLSLTQLKNIRECLLKHGLEDDVLGLFSFIKAAIEGREYSKFIFTKNLSETLKLFGVWAGKNNMSLEECAFADIQIIKELYQGTPDEKDLLERSIIRGKKKYQEGAGIVLPPLIVNASDIYQFFVPDTLPTYITLKRRSGKVKIINKVAEESLHDCILLIPSADPGYDWIFSHHIAGFITEYGGANSHMAIRAGELSIPAVVGIGKKEFERLKKADSIEIDASLKKVIILR
jgi:phosphohistidine swiveling domain-containing protein/arsenate reductase-like glutaredoxin family protein